MKLSACGLVCSECDYHPDPCPGCREVKGRPFWSEGPEIDGCALFKCCSDKKFNSCGDCADLPCRTFVDLKDPDISDEEHRLELDRRVARLKNR